MTSPNPFIDLDGKLNLLPSKFNYIDFNLSPTLTSREGRLYWDANEGTLNLGMPGGNVNLQVGQEQLIRVTAGEDILNGQLVYISGATGSNPTVMLANATDEDISHNTLAMATENITSGQKGYVTTFGLVRDVDTSSYAPGTSLHLSTTPGMYVDVEPVAPNYSVNIGNVVRQHATEGVIFVRIHPDIWKHNFQVMHDPTGFEVRDTTTMSFDDGTRTFTIEATSSSYDYYRDGFKVTKTSDSVVIDDIEGIWFIYFDETDTLVTSQTPWDFTNGKVFVAVIYWDATNNTATIGDERHGLMPWQVHRYLHNTAGSQYISGFSPELTVDGNGSLDAHCEMQSISAGVFYDEDLQHSNSIQTTYEKWYKEGANADWRWTTADSALVDMGTTYPYYNEFTGGVWQRTEVPNTKFFMMHIFATNRFSTNNKVIVVMGENYYDNKGAAQDAAPTEILGLTTGVLPTPEFLEIGTVIIQVSTAYSNSYNARVVSTSDGGDFVDFRSNEKIGIGASTNHHGNLTGLGEDDHTQYLLADGSRDVTGDLRGVDFIPTTEGIITRDVNGDVSSIEYDNRTVTITRSSGLITSYTDGVNTWTITRDVNDVITGWTVS